MLGQKTDDYAANVSWEKSLAIDLDLLTILERHDDACVRGWSTDAIVFERLDKARFGEARRRLCKVLFGT